jgi:predicted metal-dependent phosphoesterase TrpH
MRKSRDLGQEIARFEALDWTEAYCRGLPLENVSVHSRDPLHYDLHTHSYFSDGTTSPTDIAKLVWQRGLGGFSLTDHDTAAGWPEARLAASKFALDFLPGMELTTRFHGRSTHLLAFGVRARDSALSRELDTVRQSRDERAREMVRRLSADFQISFDDVAEATTQTLGRPHIADALIRAGYVADRSEAFARLLSVDSPYYVPTYALETRDAVELVRRAGGAAVLAHPAAVRHRQVITSEELEELIEAGLSGIELRHPENDESRIPPLRDLAERHGLLITGSSDYHGAGKANQLGEHITAKQVVDQLRACVAVKH